MESYAFALKACLNKFHIFLKVTKELFHHDIMLFDKTWPPFNPIALKKAKIVYNFGLSECNRVKQSFVVFGYMQTVKLLFCYYLSPRSPGSSVG